MIGRDGGTIARIALPAGFAGADAPDAWPRPPSAPGRNVSTRRSRPCTASGRRSRSGSRSSAWLTVGDLLWQRPRRYEEPVPTKRICDLFGDEEAVIEGVVRSATSRRRVPLKILTARIADETGEIKATWFNQPWLESKLVSGTPVRIRGRANRHGFAVSSYDLDGETETADFAPVYPATEDVAQKKLRDLHAQALEQVRDVGDELPASLLAAERLPPGGRAHVVHRPRSLSRPRSGEYGSRSTSCSFSGSLSCAPPPHARARPRSRWARRASSLRAIAHRSRSSHPDQERAMAEIDADLDRPSPMQRLLQGEVGSGRQSSRCAAPCRRARRQGALMAPTETLAEQHFLTIDELCAPLGVRVALLTSSLRAKEHAAVRPLIASGDAQVVVGTHALIEKEVDFGDLAVAVVDEQHRFGVAQRTALSRTQPARPPPHRDADPAHARAHRLRRPRGERARAAARRPQAGDHRLGDRRPQLRGLLAPVPAPRRRAPGLRRVSAHRGLGDVLRALPRRRPSASVRPSSAATASAVCTGGCDPPSGEVSWRASRHASSTSSSRRR